MAKIEIYTTPICPYCLRAKQYMDRQGLDYQEVDVARDPERRQEMMQRSNGHTVPQIFINDKSIGGCDDLFYLAQTGELQDLLATND